MLKAEDMLVEAGLYLISVSLHAGRGHVCQTDGLLSARVVHANEQQRVAGQDALDLCLLERRHGAE